jgi:tripartite-type tricarboxylate transporter receptor subunit TctC
VSDHDKKTALHTLMATAFRRLAVALCLVFWALPVAAQNWPSQPIRIIVPFPPGGTTDQIARRVQPLLEQKLKTAVVIENRGGASGSIGTQIVVNAPADGHTFLMVFDTHAANPSLLKLPFDTLNDLAPIMLIGTSPMVITAHPATSYQRFADVITVAKEKPGVVAYGTIGAGSLAHLAMSQIANAFNVTLTHVPYKGGGPLTTDALGGHVPIAVASIALLLPHIRAGALRPLAVTSRVRVEHLRDTPTTSELGLAGFDAEAWWGMLAPAKTPREIIARMNATMIDALQDPTVKESLLEQGIDYRATSPQAFGSFLAAEIKRWAKVVKDNNIVAGD